MATWGVGGDGGGGGGGTIAGKCKTARRDRRSYFFIAGRAVAHTAATLSTGVYWKRHKCFIISLLQNAQTPREGEGHTKNPKKTTTRTQKHATWGRSAQKRRLIAMEASVCQYLLRNDFAPVQRSERPPLTPPVAPCVLH